MAIDLGADSGRLQLDVVHRFANVPQRLADGLHWDIPALWTRIRDGFVQARIQAGVPVASIGVDTWDVDYALVDPHGALSEPPWHYRDERPAGIAEVPAPAA